MWTEGYRWHYDYVRLAWDTGFCFEKYKYPNLDKNKICLVDVERIIKERDVASVERFIPTVVQYILESDQAEVLDTNFVKLFRMSQLSVEYLLFCKKYLDNTVILLKKELSKLKEENKELKLFTQELENHITDLTKQNLITTFKCEKCAKVFSTEEYLNSHIKRRHGDENKVSSNPETDVLQSEIKQLKERLNVTEKLLQDKNEKEGIEVDMGVDENKLKVDEIQEKFERFREKVENDIQILQIQKNFYEDKYSKLFDIVVLSSNKENINPNVRQKPEEVTSNRFSAENIDKIENTTQTDKETTVSTKELQVETVHDKNVFNFRDAECSSENLSEKKENIEDTIEKKILKFEENIESKISSSLSNLESQMQAFWGKLSELEIKREKYLSVQQNVVPVSEATKAASKPKAEELKLKAEESNPKAETLKPKTDALKQKVKTSKPAIKPRTKLGKPSKMYDYNPENAVRIKRELEKMNVKLENRNVVSTKSEQRKESQIKLAELSPSGTDNTSITSESESQSKSESIIMKTLPEKTHRSKTSATTLGTWSITSMRKAAKNKEVIEKASVEINNIVNSRLQEIGISSSWCGIPRKTFDKALMIVRHQADLTKKFYPDFDSIKRSIEKTLKNHNELNREIKKVSTTSMSPSKQQPSSKTSKSSMSPEKQPNVINISYRRKSKDIVSNLEPKASTVTIKNRSLYDDTESESTQPNQLPLQIAKQTPAYSAVIQEFKSTHKNADTDSDLNSIVLPEDNYKDNDLQTKSALKSYPSMGSLTKKKVLFDIDSTDSKVEDTPAHDAGENATSTASLILEEQKERNEKDKDKKDDSSSSDFNLSEY